MIGCIWILLCKALGGRKASRLIGFAAVAIGLLAGIAVDAQDKPDGIRVREREKSLAESFLVILNDYGKKDIGQYATGITRYAGTKADFDGLISELEHEWLKTTPPDQSAAFGAALKEAVDKRIAFTSFVTLANKSWLIIGEIESSGQIFDDKLKYLISQYQTVQLRHCLEDLPVFVASR